MATFSEVAYAHCDGVKHRPGHPHCDDNGDPDPPTDSDPVIVFRDDGQTFMANADGSGKTTIPDVGGLVAQLDTHHQRILYETGGGDETIHSLGYTVSGGTISFGAPQPLLSETEIPNAGGFWTTALEISQDGTMFSYMYWDDLSVYRTMISPLPASGPIPDFSTHNLGWTRGGNDGLSGSGPTTWDASGDYLYVLETFNQGTPQWLIVMDVTTSPATEVTRVDVTDWITEAGFQGDSNTAGFAAGALTAGSSEMYSFDPASGYTARSDTSICLMVSFTDWSTRENTRFTIVIDLPSLFDPAGGFLPVCPGATAKGEHIVNFVGGDFTDDDTGILGRVYGVKKRSEKGLYVHDLSDGSRTKINGSGDFPDWAN